MTEVRQAGMARERGLIRMRRLLHDLRGQAGTFGYPLVSQVGDSACKFIDLSEDFSETEVEVIGMHVDALKAIAQSKKIGRAHVCTPVPNEHLVCRLLLEQKKK